jgi:hypothetical protein
LQELWAKVANDALARTGDEGRAIREANAVIARQAAAARDERDVQALAGPRRAIQSSRSSVIWRGRLPHTPSCVFAANRLLLILAQ